MKHLLRPLDAEEIARRAWQSVREDIADWRGASMEDHGRGLVSVLRAADAAIAGSALGDEFRAWQDPRSPEAEELWLRLVAQYRTP